VPGFIRIPLDAFWRFNSDDGWAIASHIALSALMALFPFMIFVTALAAVFGSKELADSTAQILLDTWPKEVAGPIAREIQYVLTHLRTDALTFGVVLALYFASNGIESLRIGLNRAYKVYDARRFWWQRLESIGYVFLGAVALLALSLLIVLWPLMWGTAVRYLPALEPFRGVATLFRYSIATSVLIFSLVVVHMWLPAGRRKLRQVAPGIVVTLLLWLVAGGVFGFYLGRFADTYVTTYAGLASVMVALVFLYVTASIFLYGGELNATITDVRAAAELAKEAKAEAEQKAANAGG
jgi:membrane protein